MEFRLFPHPSTDVCTPYVYDKKRNCYSRYAYSGSSMILISIVPQNKGYDVLSEGWDIERIIGRRKPNRDMIIDYCSRIKGNKNFVNFVKNTCVTPTFPLSLEEAFVKTVIRQLISAKQAKRLFSNFVEKFGYKKRVIYCFPNQKYFKNATIKDLNKIGLGFKATRILHGIKMLKSKDITAIDGIGPWSKEILEVETKRDYSLYPFWDKSGIKIKEYCGIDLLKLSEKNSELAGDIYIYSASYLESLR